MQTASNNIPGSSKYLKVLPFGRFFRWISAQILNTNPEDPDINYWHNKLLMGRPYIFARPDAAWWLQHFPLQDLRMELKQGKTHWNLRVYKDCVQTHFKRFQPVSNSNYGITGWCFCFGHCTMLWCAMMKNDVHKFQKKNRLRFHESSGHVAQWCTRLGMLQLPLWQLFVPAAAASSHQCWRDWVFSCLKFWDFAEELKMSRIQVPFYSTF